MSPRRTAPIGWSMAWPGVLKRRRARLSSALALGRKVPIDAKCTSPFAHLGNLRRQCKCNARTVRMAASSVSTVRGHQRPPKMFSKSRFVPAGWCRKRDRVFQKRWDLSGVARHF